ncbi:DMT family transporter [Zavarzinia sp. CC-PAN008]|uniref:DMT family transporter n=1 Tax=Zavarzinia sp. CC-PAN008 TaxID=3243332 RepID=UPI003F744EAC
MTDKAPLGAPRPVGSERAVVDGSPRALRQAAIMVLLAGVLYTAGNTVAKLATDAVHPLQISWFRWVIILTGFTIAGFFLGHRRLFATRQPGLQAIRGVMVFLANAGFIVAIAYMPIANAQLIAFTSPLIATLLAWAMLSERPGRTGMAALLCGFAGAMIVIGPDWSLFGWATLLPMVSAVGNAFYVLLTRKAGAVDTPFVSMATSSVVGTVLATASVIPVFTVPPVEVWAMMAAVALCFASGQFLVIMAFTRASVAHLAPLQYSELVWGLSVGMLVFATWPTLNMLVGGAVIVGAALLIVTSRR